MISVLIAGMETPPLSEQLLGFLNGQEDMLVLKGGTNLNQCLEAIAILEPSVLLLDCRLLGGGEAGQIAKLCARSPRSKVLLLWDAAEFDGIDDLLLEGARGIIGPASRPDDYAKAIRAVCNGEFWVGRKILARLLEKLLGTTAVAQTSLRVYESLTEREMDIIRCVAKGLTNKEIGKEIGISDKTVKAHLSNIYQKLNIHRRINLLKQKQ